MKIFLWNEYIRNTFEEFDDLMFLTYVGLRVIQSDGMQKRIVSVDSIKEKLYQNQTVSRWVTSGIKESIDILYANAKIDVLKDIGKQNNKWELDLSGLFLDTNKGNYSIIYQEAVMKILSLPFKDKKKISIFRYYCVLVSTMDKGVGKLPLASIRRYTDISKSSQLEYNKILEENNLIYFKRMNAYKEEPNGRLKSLSSYYGLPEKKEKIDNEANASIKKYKEKQIIKARPNANVIRSIKQKINNAITLTAEEMMTIIKENRRCDEIIKRSKDKNRINKYISKRIVIDYYEDSITTIDERKILYNRLRDHIYNVGEEIKQYESEQVLLQLVQETLGTGNKASELTINDIDIMIVLYNKLLDVKEDIIRKLQCHT